MAGGGVGDEAKRQAAGAGRSGRRSEATGVGGPGVWSVGPEVWGIYWDVGYGAWGQGLGYMLGCGVWGLGWGSWGVCIKCGVWDVCTGHVHVHGVETWVGTGHGRRAQWAG